MGKVIVLGLGPSLSLYNPAPGDFTIGVNDIWGKIMTNVVVCVDDRPRFVHERMKIIDECTPEAFYSHIDSYQNRPDFKRLTLLPYFPDHICQLNIPAVPKSLCSPFIACVVAYKYYGATEIHLYGVDLLNHPHLDKNLCAKIKIHFKNLKIALRQNKSNLIVHGEGILRGI